jgi:signal transduction histidine kinase
MIARELHDSLAQDLIAANMQCEHLLSGKYADSSVPEKGIKKISDILSGVIASVRNLAYDLRPAGLHQFGILNTLQNYCRDYSELNRIEVDFQAAGFEKISLDDFTAINLYRILQEGLLNIKKHAEASLITIRLVVVGNEIQLRLYDNGKGFDMQQRQATLTAEKKLGLRSMQERTNLLNGLLKIDSKPGRGTKIALRIPIGR